MQMLGHSPSFRNKSKPRKTKRHESGSSRDRDKRKRERSDSRKRHERKDKTRPKVPSRTPSTESRKSNATKTCPPCPPPPGSASRNASPGGRSVRQTPPPKGGDSDVKRECKYFVHDTMECFQTSACRFKHPPPKHNQCRWCGSFKHGSDQCPHEKRRRAKSPGKSTSRARTPVKMVQSDIQSSLEDLLAARLRDLVAGDHPAVDEIDVRVARVTCDGGERLPEEEFRDPERPRAYSSFVEEWEALTAYEKANVLDYLVSNLDTKDFNFIKTQLQFFKFQPQQATIDEPRDSTFARMLGTVDGCECCHGKSFVLNTVDLPRGPALLCHECESHIVKYLTEFANRHGDMMQTSDEMQSSSDAEESLASIDTEDLHMGFPDTTEELLEIERKQAEEWYYGKESPIDHEYIPIRMVRVGDTMMDTLSFDDVAMLLEADISGEEQSQPNLGSPEVLPEAHDEAWCHAHRTTVSSVAVQ